MSCHVNGVLCDVMLRYVILFCIELCSIIHCYVVILCYVFYGMPYNIVLCCYAMPCYAMLRYVLLCYILCYVMLCYVMLCYVLCYAMRVMV